MTLPRPGCPSALARFLIGLAAAAVGLPAQPVDAPVMPMEELRPGMKGEVWTVFRGTRPEPFEVEVTGIVRNALGPGKSLILCRLTDPRVQPMGAVAGMSGSPLYIDGKLAGALSYQVQRFETVRYAGFTPVADLLEVRRIAMTADGRLNATEAAPVNVPTGSGADPLAQTRFGAADTFQPLSPVFTLGGIAPNVAAVFAGPLQALGLSVSSLGGSGSDPSMPAVASDGTLRPGEAVAAALAIGDITLAGTGTVSQVDGTRVLAFGHPMLGLGAVDVPMASAEIVAILPSNQNSMKISNTGPVIGTVRQDRLSAIYGELGPGPVMVPVTVTTPTRTAVLDGPASSPDPHHSHAGTHPGGSRVQRRRSVRGLPGRQPGHLRRRAGDRPLGAFRGSAGIQRRARGLHPPPHHLGAEPRGVRLSHPDSLRGLTAWRQSHRKSRHRSGFPPFRPGRRARRCHAHHA